MSCFAHVLYLCLDKKKCNVYWLISWLLFFYGDVLDVFYVALHHMYSNHLFWIQSNNVGQKFIIIVLKNVIHFWTTAGFKLSSLLCSTSAKSYLVAYKVSNILDTTIAIVQPIRGPKVAHMFLLKKYHILTKTVTLYNIHAAWMLLSVVSSCASCISDTCCMNAAVGGERMR